jgi:hypothetical protein
MSISVRLTETKKGLWIYVNDTIIPKNIDLLIKHMDSLPIWNIYNKNTHEWLIKRKDLSSLLVYLERNGIPFIPPDLNILKQCNTDNEKSSISSQYICHPATGRWVKRLGEIGKELLNQYPDVIQKLAPSYVPSLDDMITNYEEIHLDSICSYFMENALSKSVIIHKRKEIAEKWSKIQNIPLNFKTNLTSSNLLSMFELIDYEYFNNKIQDYLKKTFSQVKIIPSYKNHIESNTCKTHCTFEMYIDINSIVNSTRNNVKFNGYYVNNHITQLQLTMEQEMSKLISLLFCDEDPITMYTKIVQNIFGHTLTPTLPTHTDENVINPVMMSTSDNKWWLEDENTDNSHTDNSHTDNSHLMGTQEDKNTYNETDYVIDGNWNVNDNSLNHQMVQNQMQGGMKPSRNHRIKIDILHSSDFLNNHVSNLLQQLNGVSHKHNSISSVSHKHNSISSVSHKHNGRSFIFSNKKDAIYFGQVLSRSQDVDKVSYIHINRKTNKIDNRIILKK